MSSYTLTKKNVNTVALCDEIEIAIEYVVKNFSVKWSSENHRKSVIEMIEMHLFDMCEDGKLTQWNVVCDRRNNRSDDWGNVVHLDITFRQRNCFNETILNFLIDA